MHETLKINIEKFLVEFEATTKSLGKSTKDVLVVLATKTQSAEIMNLAVDIIGDRAKIAFGENYLQEFLEKKESINKNIPVHYIGPIQSNKIKEIVKYFDLIESVSSQRYAELISKEAKNIDKTIPILLQTNISDDENKHGFQQKELNLTLLEYLKGLTNLEIKGLMTITAFYERISDVIPDFQRLHSLAKALWKDNLPELSMGMSRDYKEAIQCGATMIRVGTIVFGERG